MRRIMRMKKTIFSAAAALTLAAAMVFGAVPLTASAAETLDPDREVDITLTLKYQSYPLIDGEVNVCKVADVVMDETYGGFRYEYTQDFAGFAKATKDELDSKKLTDYIREYGTFSVSKNKDPNYETRILAEQMTKYAQENKCTLVTGSPISTSISGVTRVYEEGMKPGLYLIYQKEEQACTDSLKRTYDPIISSLVTMPLPMSDGTYLYKMSERNVSIIPKPGVPEPKKTPDPPTPPRPTPDPPDDPTPGRPTPPPAPPTPPAVLGAVRNPGGGTQPQVLGANRLPQTGQLWWPVPVLLISGAALMIYGGIRRRKYAD
jgi:hypothetical protein